MGDVREACLARAQVGRYDREDLGFFANETALMRLVRQYAHTRRNLVDAGAHTKHAGCVAIADQAWIGGTRAQRRQSDVSSFLGADRNCRILGDCNNFVGRRRALRQRHRLEPQYSGCEQSCALARKGCGPTAIFRRYAHANAPSLKAPGGVRALIIGPSTLEVSSIFYVLESTFDILQMLSERYGHVITHRRKCEVDTGLSHEVR